MFIFRIGVHQVVSRSTYKLRALWAISVLAYST